MQIITKDELLLNKELYMQKMLEGATMVYPTDTIYAFGANALSEEAVQRVRDAKRRPEQPFSVIAPSKEWVIKNCEVDELSMQWLDKLPGPYTIIMKRKNVKCVAPNVNPIDDTIGIRIPDHWFTSIVEELGVPMITPSANVTGMNFMTSVDDIQDEIKQGADILVDDGEHAGQPSTLVNLSKGAEEITHRAK
jgi:L-threonylcarbamoyladenylate synthase